MSVIQAPWTEDQVDRLNAYQWAGVMHEFTCIHDHSDEAGESHMPLFATTEGWVCLWFDCGYRQNWAHSMMLEDNFCYPNR